MLVRAGERSGPVPSLTDPVVQLGSKGLARGRKEEKELQSTRAADAQAKGVVG